MKNLDESAYTQAVTLLASKQTPITEAAVREAYGLLRQAADAGHPEAPYLLGEYSYYGVLVPRDEEAAFALYRTAADRGCVAAKTLLTARELGMERPTTVMVFAFLEAGVLQDPNREWMD